MDPTAWLHRLSMPRAPADCRCCAEVVEKWPDGRQTVCRIYDAKLADRFLQVRAVEMARRNDLPDDAKGNE